MGIVTVSDWLVVRMLREKRAHSSTRAALAVARLDNAILSAHLKLARDQASTALDRLVESEARCRRLDAELDFVAGHRLSVYEDEGDG